MAQESRPMGPNNKKEDLLRSSNFLRQAWLIQSHGANKPTQSLIDPTDASIEEMDIMSMQGKLLFGCIHEVLLLWDDQTHECFLLEPNTLSNVPFPPLTEPPENLMNFALTTSSVNHPDCAIIFIGVEMSEHDHEFGFQNFFLYCRRQENSNGWSKLPVHGEYLIGESSVVLEGKLYAHNYMDGVVVFDVPSLLQGQVSMTTTLLTPKFPMYPRYSRSDLNLVESCGHIYLVRTKYYGNSAATYVDIHRLDNAASNSWRRVDTIGDRAFVVGLRCYASVRAADVGAVQPNCIYNVPLKMEDERRMYKFCLDDHTMTFNRIPEEDTEYETTLCWFVPKRVSRIRSTYSKQSTPVLNEGTKSEMHAKEEGVNDIVRPWGELPIELLESILSNLSLVDVVRLCAVCKTWSLISNPFAKTKSTWPWLMYKEKEGGTYKLLDPIDHKEYATRIKKASWGNLTLMLSSKDGWVLNLDDESSVFMMNPLQRWDVIELPHLEGLKRGFHGVTFTSVPTSPDCIVFAISTNVTAADSIEIFEWRPGDKKWNKQAFQNELASFQVANTSPVFFHGELYCLGEHGHLGVFNPETKTWRVLEKPTSVFIDQEEVPFRGTHDCFLLELNDHLVSVFRSNYSNYGVSAFRLDRTKMDWIELDDLTNWALFLDHRSSFAKPMSPHDTSSNKIFFSAFFASTCVTYCMETKKFNMDFSNAKEPLDCVWLEPNLTGDYDLS